MEKRLLDTINEQIKEEMGSAYLYYSMAMDFSYKGWEGAASWMRNQAKEEMEHAEKFIQFVLDRGGRVDLRELPKPQGAWATHMEAFEAALQHEEFITGKIHDLVKLARELDDVAAEVFLQWYVTEQVEEEASVSDILQKLKHIGDGKNGLYMLDKELGARG